MKIKAITAAVLMACITGCAIGPQKEEKPVQTQQDQAITMLQGMVLEHFPLMLLTAGLFGVLSGLNDAGVHAANPVRA